MQRRKLGANGPEVGAVGYGAMSFTNFYGPATEAGSHAILDACLELGIDHIDTSNVYGMGRSEQFIGSWLAKRGGACPFTIATKAGIMRREDGSRGFDNGRAHLESELDGSLKRLGVEAVDLFYIHRRDPSIPVEEVAGTLAGFIEAGKIRSFGFSEIAPSTLRRAAAIHPVAAVQSEYSLSVRSPEMGLVQACAELGTSLVAFSPVGRAILTDTPPDAAKVAEIDFLKVNPRFIGENLTANLTITDRFRHLAADMGVPAASLAIAWLLHVGEHIIPIPGTRSVEHLREVARGAEISLTAEDLARIETVLPIGWAHGDRYSQAQWVGPERYC